MQEVRMKTIGVLGGIGPQATMAFEAYVHRVAQRLLPQEGNRGYPPMIVHYHRRAPFVTDGSWRPRMPLQPDPQLVAAAHHLGQVADFLVITSNGAHMIQAVLAEAAGRPVLSMIEVALAEVVRRGWRRVGVLGFTGPHVYIQPLETHGIAWQTIAADQQAALDVAIRAVMEGRDDAAAQGSARQAVAALRAAGADGIILGCTELPLLLHAELDAPDLLEPLALLAEAAVRHALGEQN
jgi:aspartate racemase